MALADHAGPESRPTPLRSPSLRTPSGDLRVISISPLPPLRGGRCRRQRGAPGAPSPDTGSSPPSLRDIATGREGRSRGTYAQVSSGKGTAACRPGRSTRPKGGVSRPSRRQRACRARRGPASAHPPGRSCATPSSSGIRRVLVDRQQVERDLSDAVAVVGDSLDELFLVDSMIDHPDLLGLDPGPRGRNDAPIDEARRSAASTSVEGRTIPTVAGRTGTPPCTRVRSRRCRCLAARAAPTSASRAWLPAGLAASGRRDDLAPPACSRTASASGSTGCEGEGSDQR